MQANIFTNIHVLIVAYPEKIDVVLLGENETFPCCYTHIGMRLKMSFLMMYMEIANPETVKN